MHTACLPIGSLSPILESETGLHIIRVVERRQAGRTPFLDVQNEIRKKMMDERFKISGFGIGAAGSSV